MPYYANRGGDSSVVQYEEGDDWIEVTFRSGRFTRYLYTAASCGQAKIDAMKRLAAAGRGLNSYVVTQVGKGYARRS